MDSPKIKPQNLEEALSYIMTEDLAAELEESLGPKLQYHLNNIFLEKIYVLITANLLHELEKRLYYHLEND